METRPIMRTRKVIALSLISAGAAFLFSGCPAQPPGPCVVARAAAGPFTGIGNPYATHYYFTAGSEVATGAGCAEADIAAQLQTGASTNGDFTGGVWAEAYGMVTAINKVTGIVPAEFGWTAQYLTTLNQLQDYVECTPENASLYQTLGVGGGADGGPCVDNPIVYGAFTTDTEDSNNTCTIAQSDAGTQVVNGVLVTYSIPSAVVYTNAAAGEGTQIQMKVTITRQTPTASCARSYTAIGLWPSALCNVNNDCNPLPQPGNTPPRPLGSGILTGIPLVCDLTLPGLDPTIVPSDAFCGTATPLPWISLTPSCGGGAKDNDGTNGSGNCFYTNASPTTFPYTQ
jgi:hypothetical protein